MVIRSSDQFFRQQRVRLHFALHLLAEGFAALIAL